MANYMQLSAQMIKAFADKMGCHLDVAEGSLRGFMEGHGELPAHIFDSNEDVNPASGVTYQALLKPVRDAYFAAHGVANAPVSPVEPVAPGHSQLSGEVLPVE